MFDGMILLNFLIEYSRSVHLNFRNIINVGICGVTSILLMGACYRSPIKTTTVNPTPNAEADTPFFEAEIESQESKADQPVETPEASPASEELIRTTFVEEVQVGGDPASGSNQPTTISTIEAPYPAPGSVRPTETTYVGDPYPAPSTFPAISTPPVKIPYPAPGTESPGDATQSSFPGGTTVTTSPTGQYVLLTAIVEMTPVVRTELMASDPAEFQLTSGQVQLIEFFAFWSPICKSVAPVIHRLEANYSESVNFVYLDIDDPLNNNYKLVLGYDYQPHFFLLDGQGNILNQWLGYISKDDIESAIKNALLN